MASAVCLLLIFVLAPLASTFSAVSRQLKNTNDVKPAATSDALGGDSLRLNLPQLLPLAFKYRFARVWSVKSTRKTFCDKDKNEAIRNCGIAQLYDAIDPGQSSQEKPAIYFNKALDQLCSYYDKFNQCTQDFAVKNCLSDDWIIVDVLYSYLCSDDAKKDLITENTGQCLSTVSTASLMEAVKEEAVCVNAFSDFSSSVEVMLSQFHDDSSDVSDEMPAIKDSLKLICHNWDVEERCMLPAYSKKCGHLARSFYIGLLKHMKTKLAAGYKDYGSDLSELALCNVGVGKMLMNQSLEQPTVNSFQSYISKQYRKWLYFNVKSEANFGPCGLQTTYFRLIMCFWESVNRAGTNAVTILFNFAGSSQVMIRMFKDFGHCYDDYVKDCPPENKVNFEGLLQNLIAVTSNTGNAMDCMSAIGLLQISGEKCGMTLTDIANYYLYHASKVYDGGATFLHDSDSASNVFSCLKQSVDEVSYSADNSVCSRNVSSQVRKLIDSLQQVTNQYGVFIKRYFGQME